MYKAIGFDYGGVLNKSKSALPGIAEIINIPKEELLKVYYQNNTLANIYNMSYEDLWVKILTDLGHADKAQAAVDHMHKVWDYSLNHQMLELIDEIRSKGFKTGFLSNNTKENGDKLRNEGLEKYFDCFLISAEIGYQKPAKEAFNLLLEGLQILPQELVFIDDSLSSLSQAGQIGYTPILFTGYENLKSELVNLGVIE